jgi:23S rRNA pseudouridine1911/1915/1917 synthase
LDAILSPAFFNVEPDSDGVRLDKFLSEHLSEYSRTQLQKVTESGKALVNGQVVNKKYRVSAGDRVEISFDDIPIAPFSLEPQDIPLSILYEDEHLIAINKPAGLVMHPGSGNRDGTLVNALLFRIKALSDGSAPERPGIVHRLDKDTSGVVIVAKTNSAHATLAREFAERKVHKTYIGFCIGKQPEPRGTIDCPLGRSRKDPIRVAVVKNGKPAITEYSLIRYRSGIAVVYFHPLTGRTHQIRVHSKTAGFPIVADTLYGGGKDRILRLPPLDRPFIHTIFKCFNRHALHAHSISLQHPFHTEPLTLTAPVPDDFRKAADAFGEKLFD